MVSASKARAELVRRLRKVAERFEDFYPGFKAPEVFDGFPADEPPFYVSVVSVIDQLTTGGRSTVGACEVEFTVPVMCFARMSDQSGASETLLRYVDAVVHAVMADQTLKGAVDIAFPNVSTAGCAADSSRRYMCAASVDIRCTVYSQCPQAFREVVA